MVVTVIPGVLIPLALIMYKSLFPAATEILITPRVVTISQNIMIDAAIGNPTSTQIQARTVSVSSPPMRVLAHSSGTTQQSATYASGLLSIYNMAPRIIIVPAGTVFIAPSGIQISTDTEADLPVGHLPQMGKSTVSAHALQPGSGGNVDVTTWNNCPTCQPGVIAKNFQAFSGGQDAMTMPKLNQADISHATDHLVTQLTTSTRQLLVQSMHADEKLLSSHCQPTIQPNRVPGSQVAETVVVVMMECKGETYNQSQASQRAQVLVTTQIDTMYTGTYNLLGPVSLLEDHISPPPYHPGAFSIAFHLEGRWVAQLNFEDLHQLTQTFGGMDSNNVRTLLLRKPGVQKVVVPGNFLPQDASHISLRIVSLHA